MKMAKKAKPGIINHASIKSVHYFFLLGRAFNQSVLAGTIRSGLGRTGLETGEWWCGSDSTFMCILWQVAVGAGSCQETAYSLDTVD